MEREHYSFQIEAFETEMRLSSSPGEGQRWQQQAPIFFKCGSFGPPANTPRLTRGEVHDRFEALAVIGLAPFRPGERESQSVAA